FQAEDGIRDFHVTGVQTCALPIYCRRRGVTVLTGTVVRRLERRGRRIAAVVTDAGELEAEHVVLANGPEAPWLARSLGLRLPIEIGRASCRERGEAAEGGCV